MPLIRFFLTKIFRNCIEWRPNVPLEGDVLRSWAQMDELWFGKRMFWMTLLCFSPVAPPPLPWTVHIYGASKNIHPFLDTGDFVAVGSESGAVLIWNVLSHKQEILSSSVSSPVTSVAFIGSTLYSSQSGKIFQWENSNLKESFKFDKKVKITKMTRGSSNTIIGTVQLHHLCDVKVFDDSYLGFFHNLLPPSGGRYL